MDSLGFDRLTRTLAARRSRRGAVVGLVGGMIGMPLLITETATAKK